MRWLSFLLCMLVVAGLFGQKSPEPNLEEALEAFGFQEEKIFEEADTFFYYLTTYIQKPKHLVVFIQGTDAHPLFSYKQKGDSWQYYRWFGDEYKLLDSTYAFAIIP